MILLYEGTNITSDVNIIQASITDNAGGVADSLDVVFADADKLWSQWAPQKGDKIELKHNGFSSGTMYIDEAWLINGEFKIRAISAPLSAKTPRNNSWENIRFSKFARDLANSVGLTVQMHNVTDYHYDRIDQVDAPSLEFLNERCIMEGFCLKITDGKAVIYDERTMEQSDVVLSLTPQDFLGKYDFRIVSRGIYSSCLIKYQSKDGRLISYKFSPPEAPEGPVLRPKLRAVSQGEAERYAKALLRAVNKNEVSGWVYIPLNTTIAAGNTVQINKMVFFNGKHFLESVTHYLTSGKSLLSMRRILEGY